MSLVYDAILGSIEMMLVFFVAFLVVFLLALLLKPIENKLSTMVRRHTDHAVQGLASKATFKQFSQKHH